MINKNKTSGTLTERADAAFAQAAIKVIQRAQQTGTPLILWENHQIKRVATEELPKAPGEDRQKEA